MKDKLGIITGIGISIAVITTLYLYITNAGNLEINEIFLIFKGLFAI